MTDIPNEVFWRKVFQDTATDLKAEVALAALSEIIVKQATAGNLKALVTLAGLRGIIPNPITATRIVRHVLNVNNTTTVLYTVLADTLLFIDSAWVTVENQSAGLNKGSIQIRTAVPAVLRELLVAAAAASHGDSLSNQYHLGIEVVATQDVAIWSPAASVFASGGFSGWLEDV